MKTQYRRFDTAIRCIASCRASEALRAELISDLRERYTLPMLALPPEGRESFLVTIEAFATRRDTRTSNYVTGTIVQ